MALPQGIVSDFELITRYPLGDYLNKFTEFIDNGRSDILDYYGGAVSKPNESSFTKLKNLLEEGSRIDELTDLHRDRLNNGAFWELVEVISDIQSSLWTIDNASKWLRSAISKNNFNPNTELQHVLNQLQTLESIAEEVGSSDRDNDWVTIALRNDLAEDQYTTKGGNLLLAGYKNKASIKLDSVVDNITGENVYGIDLDQKIQFIDNDLLALSYRDTIFQSVSILSTLKQGQTPEFPEDGIQSDLIVGSNRSAISYPILMKQYYNTFRRDDTLKSLTITKIEAQVDQLTVEFNIRTRLDETIIKEAVI